VFLPLRLALAGGGAAGASDTANHPTDCHALLGAESTLLDRADVNAECGYPRSTAEGPAPGESVRSASNGSP
jgi:hypothetical protein